MSTPDHDHELFGELRSLLHRPHKDHLWAEHVLDLLQLAHQQLGAQVYGQRWVAHLQRAPRASWPNPLATCTSLEKLELNASLLPVPCFALHLRHKALSDEGAKALAASPPLELLTELYLYDNDIGDEGAKALAASPHLAQLSHLHLAWNHIADDGAEALAASPHLAHLTSLNLGNNNIGEKGARAIAASAHLAQLTKLYLHDNNIGEEGAKALAESPHLAESIRQQWRTRS